MKYMTKYLSLGLLYSAIALFGGDCDSASVVTTWAPITVGQNLYTQYHKLIFPEGIDDECGIDNKCNNLLFAYDLSVTYRYMQSRNSSQISQSLWGSENLVFQGSDIQSRSENGLIAEYFGMGSDTNGYISLCPKMRNQVIDFQLAFSGASFWAQVNLPLTYSKWSLSSTCNAPAMQGVYGIKNLDGASISLNYPASGGGEIANEVFAATADNFFYGDDSSTKNNSFVDAIASNDFTNVDTDNPAIDNINVNWNNKNEPIEIGHLNMALYGVFDASGLNEKSGSTNVTFSASEVLAAPDYVKALNGYTFGMVSQRNNNLFNFNLCGVWRLADIPIMLGYDFYKSDVRHLGIYLKFVIPTGTKINQDFLKYVLSPVIGNGHHIELGIGLTGHANIWACDASSFSIYGDGYIDYMCGTKQVRTFDLPNQPMSRYALVYVLEGGQSSDYSMTNTMSPVGDINLYEGNVNGARGEFILDFVWSCKNLECGIGYAFSGQSQERISNKSCVQQANNNFFGLVGNTLQQEFGVGPMVSGNKDLKTAKFSLEKYDGTTTMPKSNFFYLGQTGNISSVASGENAIYSYGEDTLLEDAAFILPNIKNNCSGLMNSQILNRIFCHIDYIWRDCIWQPEIGLVGSFGFVPQDSPTANYWDIGARVGFAF